MRASASLCSRVTLFLLASIVTCLKFDVQSHPGAESASKQRCVRNFVARDTLVVVTATVSGYKGDGQVLNMHVCTFLSCLARISKF